MKFILMLLAVYRLTYMIVYETGPLEIFERLRTYTFNKSFNRHTSVIWTNIDEGINCPHCVSVWVSGIIYLISLVKFGDVIIGIFGLAGAWTVLNQIMDRIESDDKPPTDN